MMQKQMVDLTPPQIQQAAQAGVNLLNTPGAVNVPSTMAISGVTQVLHALLLGIAENRLAVIDLTRRAPEKPVEAGPDDPENPEVAKAVAAAVESSGNSGESPREGGSEEQGGEHS